MSFRSGDGEWQTERNIRHLREWWPDLSISTAEIAHRIGVSKNAIIGKAGRLDLPKRPNRNGSGPDSPRMRQCEAEHLRLKREQYARSVSKPLPEDTLENLPPLAPAPPIVAPRPAIDTPAPVSKPPPMPMPGTGECCWPITDRPYRYCDQPTFGRLPFCEKHASKAYQTEGWRTREAARMSGQPAHAGGDD